MPLLLLLLHRVEREAEISTAARSPVHRDRTALRLDSPFAHRQSEPHARSRCRGTWRAVERLEDPLAVFLADARPTVQHVNSNMARPVALNNDVDICFGGLYLSALL